MMDVMLRDSAERLLHIIKSASERKGTPGYKKAERLARELEAEIGGGDVPKLKHKILEVVNHLTQTKYSTDDEYKRLVEEVDTLPDDLKTRIKEGEKTDDEKKTALRIEDFQEYIDGDNGYKKKIPLRYNEITREYENGAKYADDFTTTAYSYLVNKFTRVTPDIINMYAAYLSHERAYNPVAERIGGLKWDGRDRIKELCDIIRVGEDDTLSRALVRKWLAQAIAMAENDDENPISGQGVLVLQSPQNAGKSTLVKILAFSDPKLYTDANLRVDDRDSVSRITSKWISELSEVGRVFRSNDGDALKQFLTSPKDSFRVPYGRHDETHARRVNFIATLNPKNGDKRYLNDDGGDRRFWTVVCNIDEGETFDHAGANAIDIAQLWRQAYEAVKDFGESAYRLTDDEVRSLLARNREFMRAIPGEEELKDIIAAAKLPDRSGKLKYKPAPVTASEILTYYPNELRGVSAYKLGVALRRLGYEQDTKRRYKFPLPIRAANSVFEALSEIEADEA